MSALVWAGVGWTLSSPAALGKAEKSDRGVWNRSSSAPGRPAPKWYAVWSWPIPLNATPLRIVGSSWRIQWLWRDAGVGVDEKWR